jgi:hypothetical protein
VLADVLVWRGRTALDELNQHAYRGAPTFRNGVPVPAADLHAFATPGRFDDAHLDLFLRACLALRWDGASHRWPAADLPVPPVATLGLLHPFAAGLQPAGDESVRVALQPDWPLRLSAGQEAGVHADAVQRLRQAGWIAVPAPALAQVDGPSVAAALVPRCADPWRILGRYLAHRPSDEREREEETV